ncbi:peroxidase-related enzyme [Labrys wisconsinensis]|uniref:Peroxidase-related enzyme n=1 Tax=Labrys wisconsinensis TaxID=425677 RepID=A0ABU0JLY8_9HYPH|nr:peroxidase-related enzyme [Labrys wisconsinensis]MDQ0475295.1 putative peroxidase-related enzyme [Labrys wisconsinensis]
MSGLAVADANVTLLDAAAEPLSRLGVPEEAGLPAHVRAIYAKFRSHDGFIPNWLAALSINPDTAYRLVTFYEHLFDPKRSHLTAAERELIAVVTSASNHCSYCVLNHTQALAAATGDRPRAQRIGLGYHHVHLSPRELALAETVDKLASSPTAVGDADFTRLRALGFNDQAITEILEVSAFFSYANRLTIALNVVPDRQFFTA